MQQLSEIPREYGPFGEKYGITFLNFQNSTHEYFIPTCPNLNFYFTMVLWSINQEPEASFENLMDFILKSWTCYFNS